MKALIFIISILFLFACNNNKTSLLLTTNTLIKKEFENPSFSDLYPVFELSPKTTAFVINFSEDETEPKTKLDTIFNELYSVNKLYEVSKMPNDCKVYDTTGVYRLIICDTFQQRVKPFFDKQYYVYGTLGSVKLNINDIIIGLDECKTNFFAFCLDKTKLITIGHPLFCSSKELCFKYLKDSSLYETKINSYLSKLKNDYNDNINTKILGSVGDYYFTYNDDFLWGKFLNAKCLFPSRGVFLINDKIIDYKWSKGLDLYGIPCD